MVSLAWQNTWVVSGGYHHIQWKCFDNQIDHEHMFLVLFPVNMSVNQLKTMQCNVGSISGHFDMPSEPKVDKVKAKCWTIYT